MLIVFFSLATLSISFAVTACLLSSATLTTTSHTSLYCDSNRPIYPDLWSSSPPIAIVMSLSPVRGTLHLLHCHSPVFWLALTSTLVLFAHAGHRVVSCRTRSPVRRLDHIITHLACLGLDGRLATSNSLSLVGSPFAREQSPARRISQTSTSLPAVLRMPTRMITFAGESLPFESIQDERAWDRRRRRRRPAVSYRTQGVWSAAVEPFQWSQSSVGRSKYGLYSKQPCFHL